MAAVRVTQVQNHITNNNPSIIHYSLSRTFHRISVRQALTVDANEQLHTSLLHAFSRRVHPKRLTVKYICQKNTKQYIHYCGYSKREPR